MMRYLIPAIIILAATTAAAQTPPAQPLDPLQMQVNEVKRRLAGYQDNLKSMTAAEAATKGLIAADEATLATLQAQQPKPKEQKK